MKTKKSVLLIISLVLGILYLVYSVFYWTGAGTSDLGGALATALVFPHLICTLVAVIFNALGLFMHKRGFVLTGAILYAVAMALFPVYFMFVIIQMILSFIGYARMKKQ